MFCQLCYDVDSTSNRKAGALARYIAGKEGQESDNSILNHVSHLPSKPILKILWDGNSLFLLLPPYENESTVAHAKVHPYQKETFYCASMSGLILAQDEIKAKSKPSVNFLA